LRTLLLLSEKDNVLTCTAAIKKGEALDRAGAAITALDDIPAYHKIAGAFIGAGEKVYKYGEVIGIAASDIQPGEHVHIHNVEGARGRGDRKRS
jgi:altronate dehydratase small subunit